MSHPKTHLFYQALFPDPLPTTPPFDVWLKLPPRPRYHFSVSAYHQTSMALRWKVPVFRKKKTHETKEGMLKHQIAWDFSSCFFLTYMTYEENRDEKGSWNRGVRSSHREQDETRARHISNEILHKNRSCQAFSAGSLRDIRYTGYILTSHDLDRPRRNCWRAWISDK